MLDSLPPFAGVQPAMNHLWNALPVIYRSQGAPNINFLLIPVGNELDMLNTALEAILNGFYPIRCDEWSIALWERQLGIDPPVVQTLDQRISTVMSILIGIGTPTNKALKTLAMTFNNGVINIIEDQAAQKVYIQFASNKGIPPNILDMQNAMRNAVPSHLDIGYIYLYFTWDALDAKNWTWTHLDGLSLTWDQIEVYS